MTTGWLSSLADWAWRAWIGGGVLIGVGLVLAVWAIRGDRSRGRRRCPKCWYNLRGTPGLTCSECGHTAKAEKRLYRTHRRWRWAAAGCAILLGGIALCSLPRVQRNGIYSLLPTSVLVWMSPGAWQGGFAGILGAGVADSIGAELERRCAGLALSPRQWKFVLEHGKVIRTRSRWPVNVPLVMDMRVPDWLGDCNIKIRPMFQDGREIEAGPYSSFCGNALAGQLADEVGQFAGVPKALSPDIAVKYRVYRDDEIDYGGDYRSIELEQRYREGTVNLPIQIVGSLNDALEPVQDHAATELVRQSLNVTVWAGYIPNSSMTIYLDWTHWRNSGLQDVALRVAIDIFRDSQPVETVRMKPNWDMLTAVELPTAYEETNIARSDDWHSADEAARWTLRFRGDALLALQDWDKPKYWAGEFTVPLSEVLKAD